VAFEAQVILIHLIRCALRDSTANAALPSIEIPLASPVSLSPVFSPLNLNPLRSLRLRRARRVNKIEIPLASPVSLSPVFSPLNLNPLRSLRLRRVRRVTLYRNSSPVSRLFVSRLFKKYHRVYHIPSHSCKNIFVYPIPLKPGSKELLLPFSLFIS
jgi:hypothetical protein